MLGNSTMNNTSKYVGIAICLTMIAISSYQVLRSDSRVPISASDALRQKTLVREPDTTQTPVEQEVESRSYSHAENYQRDASGFTASDIADMKKWDEDIGYIPKEDTAIYEGYDMQTLESMTQAGDGRAATTLANKYVDAGNFQKAKSYYWEAAALGVTASLGNLALLSEPASYAGISLDERKDKIKEVMALLKLAELRGDMRTANIVGKGVIQTYQANFGKLEFNESETKQIEARAQQLYSTLENRRREFGLGDFNNSTPDIIKKRYSDE